MDQIEQVARTFGVDWPHLIAQIFSFSIVCVLLYLFAYKRVLTMLEERRQRIAEGLANAEKSKATLSQLRGGRVAGRKPRSPGCSASASNEAAWISCDSHAFLAIGEARH